MAITEIIGMGLITFGVFFAFVGIVGFIRLPDVYSRIHASGKVATLGTIGILAGTAFLKPELAFKAAVLVLFLLITSPTASHSIAAAAHRQEVPRIIEARDDLGDKQPSK